MDSLSLPNLEKTYKLQKELGRGGMGVVYLASDLRLERNVALKILNLPVLMKSSGLSKHDLVEIFKTEAKAVARLNNTNIVSIYDIGEENDAYYMVMEYVNGPILADLINETTQSIEMSSQIIMQICKALEVAHSNKIIHRDVKPSNIIVSSDFVAKLMDFGIAHLGGKSSENLVSNQMDSMLGSIIYASPEQLCGSLVDQRSDLYSLGVTFYEILTGSFPFKGEKISDIIMEIISKDPVPPSLYNHKINPELEAIILKTLEKDPEKRFKSAEELHMALSFITPNTIFETNFTSMIKNRINEGKPRKGTKRLVLPTKSTNDAVIKSLEKDWSWVKNVVRKWKNFDSNLDIKNLFDNILHQTFLDNMISGAVVIDQNIYLFVHEGYFVGAVNIKENLINNMVFEKLPSKITKIELRIPETKEKNAPLIVSSILNYDKPVKINLDSREVDLVPLIDSITEKDSSFYGYIKCYTNSNIIYYGFSNGQQVFYAVSDEYDESIHEGIYKDIRTLIEDSGILLNTYNIRPNIIGPSIGEVLNKSNLNIKYREYTKSNLPKAIDIGNADIPSYLIKEIRKNLEFELILNQRNCLQIGNMEIDLLKLVKESMYYNFCYWLINDFIYQINATGNVNSLKLAYSSIGFTEKFDFFDKIKDTNGNLLEFDILSYGKQKGEYEKKYNLVICFGNGSKKDLDDFIQKVTFAKQNSKKHDFSAAFYVSYNSFDKDSLDLFKSKATEYKKGFLSFDSSKYKAYVKTTFNKGFQLCLFECDSKNKSFKLIEPTI